MTEASIMRLALRLAGAAWLLIALALGWIVATTEDGPSGNAPSAMAASSPEPSQAPTAPASLDTEPGLPEVKRAGNI